MVIAGPTASGKTGVAIQLARHFNTEILSADSRQCYREMNIGVARPSTFELAQVPHHFIASHSIRDNVDAALYEELGLAILNHIFTTEDIAIAVGGTGLYIKALCEGIDPMPVIPEQVRREVRTMYGTQNLEAIQHRLKAIDPEYAMTGEMQNPQRVMRALEVVMATGKSIRHFQTKKNANRPFGVLYLGMELPKETLHERINLRVDKMVEEGLVEEVKGLLPFKTLNALQTVGYRELFDYLEGKNTLADAIALVKTHTRQYAKRQMTWFKKVAGMHWVAPDNIEEMVSLISRAKTKTP